MIVSIDALPADHVFDVCIAGSGPAGMTLALALAEKGKSVLLLEGGKKNYSDYWQDLYVGDVIGDPYFGIDVARLRQLGGTSNHWGGWCRPLDDVDFEYKADFPEAHWPISRSDLDPYLTAALKILNVSGDFRDEILSSRLKRIDFIVSDPITNFATKYDRLLDRSQNLVLALQCAVVGVELGKARVTGFRVRDFAGTFRDVRAEKFVLACGGIENSRLLLHFNAESDKRLIPHCDALGRYWMEHPHFTIGEVVAKDEDATGREFYCLTPESTREAAVLNCGLRLEWTRQRDGLREAMHGLGCVAPKIGEWLYQRIDKRLICVGTLRAAWEQEPNPDSRITLSADRRDAFGMPLTVLDWRKTPRDLVTARTAAIELGAHLARTGRGRMKLYDWVLEGGPWPENDELGGYHHMGGTRMSAAPERGVVNSDLRLWSQENMYVAGSSVFPAGGHANPTLTIVQLSLRLADHLS